MMTIGSVVMARSLFDAVGGCEETMITWSAEGDEAKMANVDCMYADVRKRQKSSSDERIESILCNHEMTTGCAIDM